MRGLFILAVRFEHLQNIPILDLGPEIDAIKPQLDEAYERVLASKGFIGGNEVTSLEREIADYLGVNYAVGVNSGTDALVIALRSLGIGPGDEVITTPFSFFATAEAIANCGATPKFVDIEHDTFNIDANLIEAAITPKTKAILPVHLYGQASDMKAINDLAKQHGLHVVEDVAQAFGAKFDGVQLGALGAIGAFSFFPSKNLGCFGDGGMIATNDEKIATEMRKLRAHGGKNKYCNELYGYNSRLDALQAAFLRVKLPLIDQNNEGRRQAAGRYHEMLSTAEGIKLPEVQKNRQHVFHQYTLRILGGKRDQAAAKLKESGIQTMIYYPIPIHQLPVFSDYPEAYPIAELAAKEVLSIPMWPAITADIQERVCEVLIRSL